MLLKISELAVRFTASLQAKINKKTTPEFEVVHQFKQNIPEASGLKGSRAIGLKSKFERKISR